MDLQNYWVVIFGGYLTGDYRDIDICVITKTRDNKKNKELLYDFYRKLWDDNRHRLEENRFEGIKEKLDAMRQWREIRQRSKFILS